MKFIEKIRKNPRSWLREAFPISTWLPKYRVSNIPYDVVAGLTVGFTALPISLAYAQMAYLRPEYGLYSSFIAQFIYIFLGTSKDAVLGPSAIGSMLMAQFNVHNPLSVIGDNTYGAILALTNGIILFLIGVFKLGFIVNLFSIPVVSGFASASAFAISASQLKTLFGLNKNRYDSPGVFLKQIKNVYDRSDEIRFMDLTFGLTTLGILLFVEYAHVIFLEIIQRRPKPKTKENERRRDNILNVLRLIIAARNVIAFVISTGIAYWLYSQDSEMSNKLTVVGYIKPGFPTPQFPNFQVVNVTTVPVGKFPNGTEKFEEKQVVLQTTYEVLSNLSVAFIIMPLMAIMEMFAILKALGRKNGYRIDPTQELVALGLGNFLQSFLSSYPATAATTKTALNDQCKVQTPLSTVASIVVIIVSITSFTDVFYYVPKAALSAILISAAHHLFDYKAAVRIWREYKPDFFLFVTTFVLCLFYDLAYGILLAILLNMIAFLHPIIHMQLSVSKEPFEIVVNGKESSPVCVVELSHGMKYPSVDKFIDKMAHIFASSGIHVVLDCRFVTGFDFTGIQAWHMLLRLAYHHKKHLIFTNLNESALAQLEGIGLKNFHHAENLEGAIIEFEETGSQEISQAAVQKNLAQLRRLRKTISVVSTQGSLHDRQHITVHRTDSGKHITPVFSTVPTPHETESMAAPEEIKEQEARIMRLLQGQTVPNFYDHIPMAVGSLGNELEQNECESEGLLMRHHDTNHSIYAIAESDDKIVE